MSLTQEQLDRFHRFASEQVSRHGGDVSFEDLVDLWCIENPSLEERHEDLLAVKAALRDMENGDRGRSWDEFAAEFRVQQGLAQDA